MAHHRPSIRTQQCAFSFYVFLGKGVRAVKQQAEVVRARFGQTRGSAESQVVPLVPPLLLSVNRMARGLMSIAWTSSIDRSPTGMMAFPGVISPSRSKVVPSLKGTRPLAAIVVSRIYWWKWMLMGLDEDDSGVKKERRRMSS